VFEKLVDNLLRVIVSMNFWLYLGIGDWGLGIGQSPIPNPQSPIFII